jgi:copper transport protein
LLLALAGLVLAMLALPRSATAHANLVRSEPAGSTSTPTAPAEVRLWFSEQPEARYSEITVYDAARQRYDNGDTHPLPRENQALVASLQPLPAGVYTVIWKATSAVDGHMTGGSFTFAVGNLPPPSPPGGGAATTTFTPPTPAEIITKWLVFLAAACTGALGLDLFVWTPALRHARVGRDSDLGAALARRLLRLAGLALLVLLLGTVVYLLVQATKATGGSGVSALAPRVLGDFLFGTRSGGIWLARLSLPLVAVLFLAPHLVATVRRPAGPVAPVALPPLSTLFGVVLGACYLLTISLTSHGAASPLWPAFSVALDWLHLLATAVWVGGLLGLVLTVPLARRLGAGARPLMFDVVSRFSNIALTSVIVLTLTGLYSAWLHIGSLSALWPTSYGRTLLVKLAFVAGLIVLGAFNLLWVRPRLAGTSGASAVAGAPVLRHFNRAIAVEAVLGIAVLLTVAVLTGLVPSREAITAARVPQLTQTQKVGNLQVTLTLGSLQPGDNSFDVYLKDAKSGKPVTDAERVALRIATVDMDMGEAEAIATPRGDGHYTATGPYLAMSGAWQARVIVRRTGADDVEATFNLAVGSATNLAAGANPPAPPRLPALNSPWGLGVVALLLGATLAAGGVLLFRRRRRVERQW